jgi:hypothetical protein
MTIADLSASEPSIDIRATAAGVGRRQWEFDDSRQQPTEIPPAAGRTAAS